MAIFNSQMFFLGNFADMDTNEADSLAEGAADVLGLYVQPDLVSVTVSDADDSGVINDDEQGSSPGEDVTYDVGGGLTTQFVDSTIVYNIRVTQGDGSTIDITATAIQTQNGDVFLTDFANNGTLDNLSVLNIELLSVDNADFVGFFANSSVDNSQVVCFVVNTPIMTRRGSVRVQDISEGDEVWTQDHGFQQCLMTTSRQLNTPGRKRAPIQIAAGALGPDTPSETLRLSPHHRVLITSPVAMRMFGSKEVLLPAKDLLALDGVSQALPFVPVVYHHLLFERHEILAASGTLVESLFNGVQTQEKVHQINGLLAAKTPARMLIKGARARKMLERHRLNCAPQGKPFSPQPELPLNPSICAFAGQNAFEPARLVQ